MSAGLTSGCIRQVDLKESDLGVFPPDGAMALRGDVPILVGAALTTLPEVQLDNGGVAAAAVCSGAEPILCEVDGGNVFGAPTTVEVKSDLGVEIVEVTTEVPTGEALTFTGDVRVEHFGRFGVGKSAVEDMLAGLELTAVLADTVIGLAFLIGSGAREGDVVTLGSPGLTAVLPLSDDGVDFSTTPVQALLPTQVDGEPALLAFAELSVEGSRTSSGFEYTMDGVLHPSAWALLSASLDLSDAGERLLLDVDTDGDGRGDTVSLRFSGYADPVSLVEWL